MIAAGTTVVVGPAAITGPETVDAELVSDALACIDDPVGLSGSVVVDADQIWHAVMSTAVAGHTGPVRVVCPTWWPAARIRRAQSAVPGCGSNVIVQQRDDALRAVTGRPGCAVVEVGQEVVRIACPGQPAITLSRTVSVAEQVPAHLQDVDGVVVDAPLGVSGAYPLASEIVGLLEDRGVSTRRLGCADLCDLAESDALTATDTVRRRPWIRAAVIGIGVVSVTGAVVLASPDDRGRPADQTPMELTWLLEGAVAVQVPAHWSVSRMLSGSGSPRVQVISPTDPGQIIHLTQTPVPPDQTLAQAARSLREAATGLPAGVIVDFDEAGTVAERPAVTYREVRGGRIVDWSVVLDGRVRIAVGCQGAAARPQCDAAARSARWVR